jgi:hypothetical protein
MQRKVADALWYGSAEVASNALLFPGSIAMYKVANVVCEETVAGLVDDVGAIDEARQHECEHQGSSQQRVDQQEMEPCGAKASSCSSCDHADISKSVRVHQQRPQNDQDDEWLNQCLTPDWSSWDTEDTHQAERSQCDFQALYCGQM